MGTGEEGYCQVSQKKERENESCGPAKKGEGEKGCKAASRTGLIGGDATGKGVNETGKKREEKEEESCFDLSV